MAPSFASAPQFVKKTLSKQLFWTMSDARSSNGRV
jgi:hypothetical protein